MRYQIYGITRDGELIRKSPFTYPIDRLEKAQEDLHDFYGAALVSIDEHGTIIEVLEKVFDFPEENKPPKYVNSKR